MYAGAVPPPPGAPNLARGTSSPCGAPTAVGPIIRQARCPAPKRRRLSGDHGRDLPEKILELKYSPFPGPAGMQLLWERSLRRLSFLGSRRSDGELVSSPTAFAHALLVSSPTPSSMLVSSPLSPRYHVTPRHATSRHVTPTSLYGPVQSIQLKSTAHSEGVGRHVADVDVTSAAGDTVVVRH